MNHFITKCGEFDVKLIMKEAIGE